MNLHKLLLDCIYPRRCPVCHDIVVPKGRSICKACEGKLQFLVEPRCKCCSKMLLNEVAEYCADCQGENHAFDGGMSIFPYDEIMQYSMVQFKFYGRQEYGEFYAEMMQKFAGATIKRWQPDILIPVPLHPQRLRWRGYNQSEVIGRALGKRFSIPVRSDLIKRVKNTKAQKELHKGERQKNLHGAFVVGKELAQYRCALIVDDIYTTGSTVDELARVLKQGGIKRVFFITVCIGCAF